MADSALEPRAGTQVIDRGVLPTTEVISRVLRIQEVMKAVMQKDTHYGVIPGTQKPTLYKPGAEKIASVFRLAITPVVTDLSTPDEIRYRVEARAVPWITRAHPGPRPPPRPHPPLPPPPPGHPTIPKKTPPPPLLPPVTRGADRRKGNGGW